MDAEEQENIYRKKRKMNMKQAGWVVMAIALAACSGGKQSHGDERKQEKAKFVTYSMVDDLPVVAHSVEVDGQEVTVCELGLLKDTLDLPLSYWVEDFEVVKLDTRDEALVGQGSVLVSDNYILVGRSGNVPCKLFRRDGSYVDNVGSIGQGPGEYTMVYDMQIDEQAERIYLLPWNAKSILVYNLRGEYLSDIPLNKKYEKLIVPKGKFKVDAAKNRVAVILLPFNYLPVVAWVQDMEGNFLHEVPMNHLKVTPDFSNEVISAKASSDALDTYLFTFWELRRDTLYHLSLNDGKLHPKFTLDFGQRDITIHNYLDFPGYYIGSLEVPVQISENTYETRGRSFYMVDKKSGKGTFFRLNNDYLDNESEKYMPFQFSNGYYTLNIEPAILMERLEKGLNKLDADRQEQMKSLLGTIDENDNNYILIGKLKRGL